MTSGPSVFYYPSSFIYSHTLAQLCDALLYTPLLPYFRPATPQEIAFQHRFLIPYGGLHFGDLLKKRVLGLDGRWGLYLVGVRDEVWSYIIVWEVEEAFVEGIRERTLVLITKFE